MAHPILDRFTSPSTMMDAEAELLALGAAAVPILESVLNGTSTNDFGVPHRKLGLPLRCALEVARRLGAIAQPIEPLIRAELRLGNVVAAQALGALGRVDEESIVELAAHLDHDNNGRRGNAQALDLAAECTMAIVKLGHEKHTAVVAALERSPHTAASALSDQLMTGPGTGPWNDAIQRSRYEQSLPK